MIAKVVAPELFAFFFCVGFIQQFVASCLYCSFYNFYHKVRRAIKKRSPEPIYQTDAKRSKGAINILEAIGKSPILLSQYWKQWYFDIFHSNKPLLRNHVRVKHTRENLFSCSLCDLKFANQVFSIFYIKALKYFLFVSNQEIFYSDLAKNVQIIDKIPLQPLVRDYVVGNTSFH